MSRKSNQSIIGGYGFLTAHSSIVHNNYTLTASTDTLKKIIALREEFLFYNPLRFSTSNKKIGQARVLLTQKPGVPYTK